MRSVVIVIAAIMFAVKCAPFSLCSLRRVAMNTVRCSITSFAVNGDTGDASKILAPPEPSKFSNGQSVRVEVLQFGPLGASVIVLDDESFEPTRGLIRQSEIGFFREKRGGRDVTVGEQLTGFIGRIRETGRLDIHLRPLGRSRINNAKSTILEALEGSPTGSIPVGDRSSPEDINSYFYGMSKTDFKMAVGALYKDGFCYPGSFETRFRPEEDRDVKSKIDDTVETVTEAPLRATSANTLFIGNLPPRITEEDFIKYLKKEIGSNSVEKMRFPTDDKGNPKGFCFVDVAATVNCDDAIAKLKAKNYQGRSLRVDYENSEKKLTRKSGDRKQRKIQDSPVMAGRSEVMTTNDNDSLESFLAELPDPDPADIIVEDRRAQVVDQSQGRDRARMYIPRSDIPTSSPPRNDFPAVRRGGRSPSSSSSRR